MRFPMDMIHWFSKEIFRCSPLNFQGVNKVFSLEKTLFWIKFDFFGGVAEEVGKTQTNLVIKLLDLCEVLMPNMNLLLGLEPFKKFSVGGWVVDTTVNIVFCFGLIFGLKTKI